MAPASKGTLLNIHYYYYYYYYYEGFFKFHFALHLRCLPHSYYRLRRLPYFYYCLRCMPHFYYLLHNGRRKIITFPISFMSSHLIITNVEISAPRQPLKTSKSRFEPKRYLDLWDVSLGIDQWNASSTPV